jgi:aspartate/glutamate racemase
MQQKLTLSDFIKLVSKAKTQEELQNITYQALSQDENPNDSNSLYNKVFEMSIKRTIEIGGVA